MKTVRCENCGREMEPAAAKLRADGEQTYCGFLPCPCDKVIFTECGAVYPGTEEHESIVASKQFIITTYKIKP